MYEDADVPITNCRKEKWSRRRNIKYPCGVCQSCIDQKRSEQITAKHQYGRFCKGGDNNQCKTCTFIKNEVKLLKRLASADYHDPKLRAQTIKYIIRYFYKYLLELKGHR